MSRNTNNRAKQNQQGNDKDDDTAKSQRHGSSTNGEPAKRKTVTNTP